MQEIKDKLEELFEKVRNLPEDRKVEASRALTTLTQEDTYVLSEEELAIIMPELEGAMRGEFATEAEVDDAINKPWA
jgi:hypothetical protein